MVASISMDGYHGFGASPFQFLNGVRVFESSLFENWGGLPSCFISQLFVCYEQTKTTLLMAHQLSSHTVVPETNSGEMTGPRQVLAQHSHDEARLNSLATSSSAGASCCIQPRTCLVVLTFLTRFWPSCFLLLLYLSSFCPYTLCLQFYILFLFCLLHCLLFQPFLQLVYFRQRRKSQTQ